MSLTFVPLAVESQRLKILLSISVPSFQIFLLFIYSSPVLFFFISFYISLTTLVYFDFILPEVVSSCFFLPCFSGGARVASNRRSPYTLDLEKNRLRMYRAPREERPLEQ